MHLGKHLQGTGIRTLPTGHQMVIVMATSPMGITGLLLHAETHAVSACFTDR